MNRRSFLFFASATGVLSARPGGLQQALEILPPRRNSAPAPGPLCRGTPIRRISATQPTQTALPGNAIPKYVDPLPTFAGRRISAANIKVSIAELQQQVLPASLYASLPAPYREGTLVWGYKVGGAPPHYPGFTIEARSRTRQRSFTKTRCRWRRACKGILPSTRRYIGPIR
jgi:hypothetical protein